MEIKEVIGIDTSKLTLDCCIHTIGEQAVFENLPVAISKMVDWSIKTIDMGKTNLLFVFEHTCQYI